MNGPRHVEPELMEREVPPPDVNALPALLRAEIDGQIATARAFPRSNSGFIREATELVCLTEEMAESCIYALPRGKGADKKTIEGPSARFAEVIQHCFGNNRGGARVVAEDGEFITAQGTYHDLEKNVQVVMEVKRRITDSKGRRYNADMIGVTGNAAASIAHRNAVLKGIPKAMWLPIYERARAVVVGDVTTLTTKREQALAWFAKVGVTPEQIVATLGVGGVEDIGLDELAILAGIKTAIREGSTTPEQAFAPEQVESNVKAPTSAAGMADVAAKLKDKGKAKPKDEPTTTDTTTGEITVDPAKLRGRLFTAETLDELDAIAADLGLIADEEKRAEVNDYYLERCEALGRK